MPSSPDLTPAQVWDLVNFIRILPYPKMRASTSAHGSRKARTRARR